MSTSMYYIYPITNRRKKIMKKAENKKNAAKNATHLLFAPERKVIADSDAMKMAARATDYNDSRSEARNFKCMEFNGVKFTGEDLSGIEAHYAKFENCEFSECKLSRMEAYFAEFSNCTFTNCDLENSNFGFAEIADTVFFNCNMDGVDFPFVQGNFSCTGCMMERSTANNANLHLVLSQCNAAGFEANCSKIEIDAAGCSFNRSEFNDSTISGKFMQCDLTCSEFNRADLTDLGIENCATHNMETEDSTGCDIFDQELEDALDELEEVLDD